MRKPVVYVLVGVPGSGKSTWIKNQTWALGLTVASTDNFIEDYAKKQGKTYSEVFDEYMPTAVDLMSTVVVHAREHGHDIIWDQTSTTVKSRARKFRMLRDYEHIAVVFKTPERDELDARLASRPGKNIPQEVVSSMISTFELPTKEEGYKEVWHV
jgi:predicted kinase